MATFNNISNLILVFISGPASVEITNYHKASSFGLG